MKTGRLRFRKKIARPTREMIATPPIEPPMMAPVLLLEVTGGIVSPADEDAATEVVTVTVGIGDIVDIVADGDEIVELVVAELDKAAAVVYSALRCSFLAVGPQPKYVKSCVSPTVKYALVQ